nr:MAG TPA: hypothetical protein [Bacteriophage sp.]
MLRRYGGTQEGNDWLMPVMVAVYGVAAAVAAITG